MKNIKNTYQATIILGRILLFIIAPILIILMFIAIYNGASTDILFIIFSLLPILIIMIVGYTQLKMGLGLKKSFQANEDLTQKIKNIRKNSIYFLIILLLATNLVLGLVQILPIFFAYRGLKELKEKPTEKK